MNPWSAPLNEHDLGITAQFYMWMVVEILLMTTFYLNYSKKKTTTAWDLF